MRRVAPGSSSDQNLPVDWTFAVSRPMDFQAVEPLLSVLASRNTPATLVADLDSWTYLKHEITTMFESHVSWSPPTEISLSKLGKIFSGGLSRLARPVPGEPPKYRAHRTINRLIDNIRPTRWGEDRRLIVIGATPSPPLRDLFPNRHTFTVLVQSGWDHAWKIPTGFIPDVFLAWNRPCAEDWLEQQGAREILITGSWRHGYLQEKPRRRRIEGSPGRQVRFMYAPSASLAGGSKLAGEERLLIEDLAVGARLLGWNMLVKPKPEEQPGALDEFRKHPNVTIGTYLGKSHPRGYVLSDQYNAVRRDELEMVNLVVVWGTTFALDAATAGLPVVLLDFGNASRYPVMRKAQRAAHLQRHLLRSRYRVELRQNESATDCLLRTRDEWLSRGESLSQSLRTGVARTEPTILSADAAIDRIQLITSKG